MYLDVEPQNRSKHKMPHNGLAHLQPGFAFPVFRPRSPSFTGCQVQRGLGCCASLIDK